MTEDEQFEWVRRQGGDKYAAWLAAGYRECYCPNQRSTPFLLQRRIRDESGVTLFFVDCWVYDWREYPRWSGEIVSYDAECNYNNHSHDRHFSVTLSRPESPSLTEEFFLKICHAMGCEPYGDD